MKWTDLLKGEAELAYQVAEALIKLVDKDKLNWKPATGSNWMTTGQLLMHISNACGMPCKGFVTGDWGLPPGADPSKMKPEDMMPPAEKMPTAKSVDEVVKLLATDKKTAMQMIVEAGEKNLETKKAPAPWDPSPMPLGHRLLQMVQHLNLHKSQLYYYLKLQGKPVNTSHLWGM
ncbi:MAG: DinB family protein [Planctomycetaceae bacterium]